MPLNGNVKDEVSGTYGTWYGTATYQTLSSGLKVADISNSHYLKTPIIATNQQITVSGWIKRISGDCYFRMGRGNNSTSDPRTFYQISVGNSTKGGGFYRTRASGSGVARGGEGGSSSNGWFYCVLVCGSNGVKVYSNGELVYSDSNTNYIRMTLEWWFGYKIFPAEVETMNGYFSDIIIEKAQWTLSDITKMFNKKKALYGL